MITPNINKPSNRSNSSILHKNILLPKTKLHIVELKIQPGLNYKKSSGYPPKISRNEK